MNNTINGIALYELGDRNKEFKKEYLNECLQLIADGEFEENAMEIVNRCVPLRYRLKPIHDAILECNLRLEKRLIEDLQEFKNEGFNYIDGNLQPWEFGNDKEIINYALEHLY
jgi:hypothetical protein